MRLRLGRRKILGLLAVGVTAAMTLAAWRLWGTDGLLIVLIAISVTAPLGLGLFVARSERRSRLLATKLQTAVTAAQGRHETKLDGFDRRLDDIMGRVTWRGEQAEGLLTAVNARFTRAELAQERLVDALRQNASDTPAKIIEAVRSDTETIVETVRRLSESHSKHSAAESRRLFRQVEALLALYADIKPESAFPSGRSWAASPDLLVYLYETVRKMKPALILECGSGVSTIVMAHALSKNATGRLVALEHLAEYRNLTMEWTMAHGVEEWVDVRLAPLIPVRLGEEEWPWYSINALPEGDIDLLFVDGPPGTVWPRARFPALPVLADRLSPGAQVVLDDAFREDEHTIADQWVADNPRWEMIQMEHEKGTVILTRRA